MASGKMRQVVIDDTYPAIKYKGKRWSLDGGDTNIIKIYGPPFNNTMHTTDIRGKFSYTFNGTSVAVHGIINAINADTQGYYLPDQGLECFIDNVPTQNDRPHRKNPVLCEQHDIPDGKHELEVQFRSADHSFSLDHIRYTPSPGLSFETAVVLVENEDSDIFLDSSWNRNPKRFSSTQVFDSTATFNFTGTSVTWVGVILPSDNSQAPASATYSIDGGHSIPFNISNTPYRDHFTNINHELFSTPTLSTQPHTLVVTYKGDNKTLPLTLNHLYITNTSAPVQHIQPQKPQSPVGVIIGSVIGGLSTVMGLLLFVFWWYRRQKRRRESREEFRSNPPPPRYTLHAPNIPSSYTNPVVPSECHHSYSMQNSSITSFSLPGYNSDTIAQTRALQKYQGIDPQAVYPSVLQYQHQEKPSPQITML